MGKASKYKAKGFGVVKFYHPAYGSLSVNLANAEQWELKALYEVGSGQVEKISNARKTDKSKDSQDSSSGNPEAAQPTSTDEGTEQAG